MVVEGRGEGLVSAAGGRWILNLLNCAASGPFFIF